MPSLKENIISANELSDDFNGPFEFLQPFKINNIILTQKNIVQLSVPEREKIARDIFQIVRRIGWNYTHSFPEDFKAEIRRLQKKKINIENQTLNAFSHFGNDLCKYYCRDFYKTHFYKKNSIRNAFNDDDYLLRAIQNRLGIDPRSQGIPITLTFSSLLRGFVEIAASYSVSLFRTVVGKAIYEKYSSPGDLVLDYSAGWGGRMLGAVSSERNYLGIDPLTAPDLQQMVNDLQLPNVQLIHSGSEEVELAENSIDFAFSSPPYYNTEIYSPDISQAYNRGEEYFYANYWKKTLELAKMSLKPGKYFGVNIVKNPRMLQMAVDQFGPTVEEITMISSASHLKYNLTQKTQRSEKIYIFRNFKP